MQRQVFRSQQATFRSRLLTSRQRKRESVWNGESKRGRSLLDEYFEFEFDLLLLVNLRLERLEAHTGILKKKHNELANTNSYYLCLVDIC